MSTERKYGQAFELIRAASGNEWENYTHHSFVEGLGDGTLPYDAFLHYLQQDYVYLIHYSRAWALAVVKSETHEEMATTTAVVNGLINTEFQLHIETCAKAGISQNELFNITERTETLAYTRFVLEAGYSGDFLSLLAALIPCVMGYGEIGLRLSHEATSETYREWINVYASDEYQQSCQSVGRLFDNAIMRRLGKDYAELPCWANLCKTFKTATRLEGEFWQMGMNP